MKNWMKKHWVLTLLFFVASVAMAAKITENNLKIGQPGSTGDKVIEFDVGDGASNPTIVVDNTDKDFDFNKAMNIAGDLLKIGDGTNTTKEVVFDIGAAANNPRFRWNSSFNTLEFTTDGTSFKKIGSGSGGASGVNVIAENNFDFETGAPPTDWTASGGTFTAETASPLFGAASGSWNSNALDQTLDSVLAPITTGFLGRTCQAAIEYKYETGTAGDYQLIARQFDDSGATEIDVAVLDLEVTGTTSQPAILFFTCPDDVADDLRIRIQSKVADAGVIVVDDAFIGTGRATQFGVPSNEITYKYLTAPVAGTNSDIADLRFTDLEVGAVYDLKVQASSLGGTPGEFIATHNGTVILTLADKVGSVDANDRWENNGTATFTAVNSNLTFGYTDFAEGASLEGNGSTTQTYVTLEKRNDLGAPSESITLETVGKEWAGVIDRASAPFLLPVVSAGPSELTNSTLSLKNLKGDAWITCEAGEAASGTTCSGNEAIGISFLPNVSGTYQVCFNAINEIIGTAGTGIKNIFYQNNTDALSSATSYGEFTNFSGGYDSSSGNRFADDLSLCNDFELMAGQRAYIKLSLLTEIVGASPTSNTLGRLSHGNGGAGILRYTAKLKTNQFPTPVFTDLQNSLNSKVETAGTTSDGTIIFGGFFSNSGSPIFQREYGDYVDSLTDNGVGDVTINFEPGKIADFACTCSSRSANTVCVVTTTGSVGTQVQVLTYLGNTAASVDRDVHWTCVGRKQ